LFPSMNFCIQGSNLDKRKYFLVGLLPLGWR
jgi:hypothetical protein